MIRHQLDGSTIDAEPAQASRLPDSFKSRVRVEPTLSAAAVEELQGVAAAHGRTVAERRLQFLHRAGLGSAALRERFAEPLPMPAEPPAVELPADWPPGLPIARFMNALAGEAQH